MHAAIRPRRSILYMPGSNARALQKARTLPADVLILDLEDAVAPDMKEQARVQVGEAVRARAFGSREVVIRINALSTEWGNADLNVATEARPDAILLPKVSRADDLRQADARISGRGIALWAMIETPLAILNIASIADAGGVLACFVMGTNDLVKDMRGQHMPRRENLAPALALAVTAARASGLAIIDGVHNDIADLDSFRDACIQARAFGFDGKTLIHPSQLAICNDVFAPARDEVEAARKIIAAFERPENSGKGAIALDGHMVERLHAEAARGAVALAEAIAARENTGS
ncbi:MAG TPA: CoA ester lyase [Rhizomicrobium sp.]|jgi:citrate lyase subunit beta/citryl-CoA lyase|nr:CoA ester lyase [Rhizomicrobium sp.]